VCVNSVIKVTRTTAKPKIHLGLKMERPISLNDMSDLDSEERAMVTVKQKKKDAHSHRRMKSWIGCKGSKFSESGTGGLWITQVVLVNLSRTIA
jgi:hypothetical protein